MEIWGPGFGLKYRITTKGIAEKDSFRGKVAQWYEGTILKFPYSDIWGGTLLDVFAQYPEEGLTLYEAWGKAGLLPFQLEATYGDWVDLGTSIKERDPTPGTSLEVNHALNAILEEERGEAEEDAGYTAKDAKWWLIDKATDLGII